MSESSNESKPMFSSESSKKEEKKSNFEMSIGFASKRHALQADGIYNQAVWNQQFESLCRKWGREERKKKTSKKSK